MVTKHAKPKKEGSLNRWPKKSAKKVSKILSCSGVSCSQQGVVKGGGGGGSVLRSLGPGSDKGETGLRLPLRLLKDLLLLSCLVLSCVVFWRSLGGPWGVLGMSWWCLGWSWVRLGRSWESWVPLWGPLGRLRGVLGRSWGVLGAPFRSWGARKKKNREIVKKTSRKTPKK